MTALGQLREWRAARRKRAWETACWKLRIPSDVQARMEKMDPEHRDPPTWYAGRQTPCAVSEAIHDVPPVMRCEQCHARRGVTDEWGPWLCRECATSTEQGDAGWSATDSRRGPT